MSTETPLKRQICIVVGCGKPVTDYNAYCNDCWKAWEDLGLDRSSTIVRETMAQHTQELTRETQAGKIRVFETGATRDVDTNKHEYSGFNSPLVEKRFAEYMTRHRIQTDGSVRSSSNWKKGIPVDVYQQSLHRHFVDLWLHMDGYADEATEPDIESTLCALRFNVNGLLHEIVKKRLHKTP